MAYLEVEVPCNFVGEFKVGDNLVYNAKVLSNLVFSNEDGGFNKPIVTQIGSILEASLGQIIYRAQNFNLEGVPNISEEDQQAIVGEKADKLYWIIDVMRKYGVLGGLEQEIYEELHKLRKYRNKVHIRDDINIPNVSRDDDVAFSDGICRWAIDLNSKVITHLSDAFPRPAHVGNWVGNLALPVWNPDAGEQE